MKLYFTNTTAAPFIARQLAESSEISNQFSRKIKSGEDEITKKEECEQETSRYCATSLESLIDFGTSKLGKDINLLINEVKTGSQGYEFGEGVKMVADKSVVCHKRKYPYAVFYCHTFQRTRTYMVPLVGGDGREAKAIAVCHMDTSAWHPNHLVFRVLKVKPGTPVCHFLSNNDIVWIPK